MGSVAYFVLWFVNCDRREKVMDEFLEALSKQFDDATIQKAQELLDDVLDIVNQNGEAGFIAGNLYYQLMSDELQKFVDENNLTDEGNVNE